jgi:hypothetical protein
MIGGGEEGIGSGDFERGETLVLVFGLGTAFVLSGWGMTPVEIAEAYMTAYDNYDSTRTLELLVEDVGVEELEALRFR